jgi:hypothetical protein
MARVTLIEVGSETDGQATEYQCRVGANGLLADGIDDGEGFNPARAGGCTSPCPHHSFTTWCTLNPGHYGSHMCSDGHGW